MGVCWYCHWGWAKQVREIYDRGLAASSERAMNYGPAHIVWDDENFQQWCVEACLKACDTWKDPDISVEQIAVVRQSLIELLALPEDIREPQPADYDDENPRGYPPAPGIEMIQ